MLSLCFAEERRDDTDVSAPDPPVVIHVELRGTPSLREVRAEGWSELSPRCVGAAARRAGLSPSFCDAPISRRPVCFLLHTLTPLGSAELGGFSRVPMVSGPESSGCYQLRERSYGPGGSILEKVFSLAISNLAAAQVKNFYVFGCGWWYDREIVLLPPLCEYRERLRERLPGNSASGPHSSRRVQAPSRP